MNAHLSAVRIVLFGAGAMGSLVGGLLSRENHVVLIGRKEHVEAINKRGLSIKGRTNAALPPSRTRARAKTVPL